MKIEEIKRIFIITPNISVLKLNIDELLYNQETHQQKRKLLIILSFFLLLISLYPDFSLYSLPLFFTTLIIIAFISKYIYNTNQEIKQHINEYNDTINLTDELNKYYLINQKMYLKYVNNYNIYFSNLLFDIKNNNIICKNLNFVELSEEEFSEEIYQKLHSTYPYLFKKKKIFNINTKKENKKHAAIDFFNIANTRFNLANDIIYFINLYEKDLTKIYMVIDTDEKYSLTTEELNLQKYALLKYSFDFLDIRIEFNKTKNFNEQKFQQNEISKKILNLFRSIYLTRNKENGENKKETRSRKKI